MRGGATRGIGRILPCIAGHAAGSTAPGCPTGDTNRLDLTDF
jgi:hypothetical protein